MNVCGELVQLCNVVRAENDDRGAAVIDPTLVRELERLLKLLPEDDISLVGAESAAIYFEAVGDFPRAMDAWRSLVERIYCLRKSMEGHECSEDVRRIVLDRSSEDDVDRCITAIERLKSRA